jgi:hypothetical protein
MWDWENSAEIYKTIGWKFLNLKDGRHTMYDRFLANVVEAKHQDIIVPIQCTSIVGFGLVKRYCRQKKIPVLPDVIYLDSAHETDETFLELSRAWELEPKVLFGDDYDWTAVARDVKKFAATINKQVELDGNHWFLRK